MQIATLFRESANLLGASSIDTSQTHLIQQQQLQQMHEPTVVDYGHQVQQHYKM